MPTFDPDMAASYGSFIDAAYLMFGAVAKASPPVQRPAVAGMPSGYTLFRYITMNDFILGPGTLPSFYGFIAQRDGSNDYVLAMRGTSTWTEWWDDAHMWPLAGFTEVSGGGNVSPGFHEIYQTLQLLPPIPAAGEAAPPLPQPIDLSTSFAQKVSAALAPSKPMAPAGRSGEGAPADIGDLPSLVVTGHSLGSALVTLFVVENAQAGQLHTPGVYTFASPRVGNSAFADAYAALAEKEISTWRIVNAPDIVLSTRTLQLTDGEQFAGSCELVKECPRAREMNRAASNWDRAQESKGGLYSSPAAMRHRRF